MAMVSTQNAPSYLGLANNHRAHMRVTLREPKSWVCSPQKCSFLKGCDRNSYVKLCLIRNIKSEALRPNYNTPYMNLDIL